RAAREDRSPELLVLVGGEVILLEQRHGAPEAALDPLGVVPLELGARQHGAHLGALGLEEPLVLQRVPEALLRLLALSELEQVARLRADEEAELVGAARELDRSLAGVQRGARLAGLEALPGEAVLGPGERGIETRGALEERGAGAALEASREVELGGRRLRLEIVHAPGERLVTFESLAPQVVEHALRPDPLRRRGLGTLDGVERPRAPSVRTRARELACLRQGQGGFDRQRSRSRSAMQAARGGREAGE